jgi:hypothetical protein
MGLRKIVLFIFCYVLISEKAQENSRRRKSQRCNPIISNKGLYSKGEIRLQQNTEVTCSLKFTKIKHC